MGQKLLIVEDNLAVRELLALALSEAGFYVITAEDGYAGLDQAVTERPDLILTDIEMPNLDGIQMIQRLRLQPECQRIPVLVMSAVHAGVLRQAVSAGANVALQKPVQLMSLIRLVKQILGTAPAIISGLSIFLLNIS